MTDLLDEDALRHLARPDDAVPAPLRPLSDVRRRARRLRLQRRTGVGLTGAAVGLAAASAFVALPDAPGRPSRAVVPAASGTDLPVGCSTGYATVLEYADVPDLLYLPSQAAAGPLTGPVRPRSERSDCPPERVDAVAAERTGGTVTAALTVYGPDAAAIDNPLGPRPGEDWTRFGVTAGGRTFDVMTSTAFSRPQLRASWTEPDGSTWRVELDGLELAQAQGLLADLRVTGGRLDLDALPAGVLPERTSLTADQQPRRVVRLVSMTFGAPEDASSESGRWGLSVADGRLGPLLADARVGSRRIPWGDGSDRYLVWGDNGDAKSRILQWSGDDGTAFTVMGDVTLAEALRVARSVRKVTPDDPRLVAARETPAPSST